MPGKTVDSNVRLFLTAACAAKAAFLGVLLMEAVGAGDWDSTGWIGVLLVLLLAQRWLMYGMWLAYARWRR